VDNGDNSGNEYEIEGSLNKNQILKSMFLTDEERIYVDLDGKPSGSDEQAAEALQLN
jgi:hypothetical protein